MGKGEIEDEPGTFSSLLSAGTDGDVGIHMGIPGGEVSASTCIGASRSRFLEAQGWAAQAEGEIRGNERPKSSRFRC